MTPIKKCGNREKREMKYTSQDHCHLAGLIFKPGSLSLGVLALSTSVHYLDMGSGKLNLDVIASEISKRHHLYIFALWAVPLFPALGLFPHPPDSM